MNNSEYHDELWSKFLSRFNFKEDESKLIQKILELYVSEPYFDKFRSLTLTCSVINNIDNIKRQVITYASIVPAVIIRLFLNEYQKEKFDEKFTFDSILFIRRSSKYLNVNSLFNELIEGKINKISFFGNVQVIEPSIFEKIDGDDIIPIKPLNKDLSDISIYTLKFKVDDFVYYYSSINSEDNKTNFIESAFDEYDDQCKHDDYIANEMIRSDKELSELVQDLTITYNLSNDLRVSINNCSICMTEKCSHVCVPCGHNCICYNCSKMITQCPICRDVFEQVIKIFT